MYPPTSPVLAQPPLIVRFVISCSMSSRTATLTLLGTPGLRPEFGGRVPFGQTGGGFRGIVTFLSACRVTRLLSGNSLDGYRLPRGRGNDREHVDQTVVGHRSPSPAPLALRLQAARFATLGSGGGPDGDVRAERCRSRNRLPICVCAACGSPHVVPVSSRAKSSDADTCGQANQIGPMFIASESVQARLAEGSLLDVAKSIAPTTITTSPLSR